MGWDGWWWCEDEVARLLNCCSYRKLAGVYRTLRTKLKVKKLKCFNWIFKKKIINFKKNNSFVRCQFCSVNVYMSQAQKCLSEKKNNISLAFCIRFQGLTFRPPNTWVNKKVDQRHVQKMTTETKAKNQGDHRYKGKQTDWLHIKGKISRLTTDKWVKIPIDHRYRSKETKSPQIRGQTDWPQIHSSINVMINKARVNKHNDPIYDYRDRFIQYSFLYSGWHFHNNSILVNVDTLIKIKSWDNTFRHTQEKKEDQYHRSRLNYKKVTRNKLIQVNTQLK